MAMPPEPDLLNPPPAPPAAPTAVPPTPPPYEPITMPQGGLLASTVGTPQQPLPPVDPNAYNQPTNNIQTNTFENDDVVNQLNRITSQDSDYMTLARTAGLQTANKRGLLNSSMAVGASQAEALRAAAPLAVQNAQQMAARNLERLSSGFAAERQQAQFGHETGMQERQLTAAEEQQMRDINARMTMQGIDIEAQNALQQRALDNGTMLAQMQIDAESERLGRQLSAAEEQQIRDLSSREMLTRLDIASREGMNAADIASRLEITNITEGGANLRANLDAATRVQLLAMENLSQEQVAALNFYMQSNEIYARSLDNLYANKDMPAPARNAAMQNFLALRNSTANLPAIVFGTNLSWPSPTTTPTTTTPQTNGTTVTQPVPAPAGTTTPQIGGFVGGLLEQIRAQGGVS